MRLLSTSVMNSKTHPPYLSTTTRQPFVIIHWVCTYRLSLRLNNHYCTKLIYWHLQVSIHSVNRAIPIVIVSRIQSLTIGGLGYTITMKVLQTTLHSSGQAELSCVGPAHCSWILNSDLNRTTAFWRENLSANRVVVVKLERDGF